MVDATLAEVGRNLSDAMSFLGDGERELEAGSERRSFSGAIIPGPLQGDGQDAATILHLVHNLMHEEEEEEEEEDPPSQQYENGSAYFHEDGRDGLVKVCRLAIHTHFEEYASEGYGVLGSKQPVVYHSASGRPGLGQHLCSQLGLPLSSLCAAPCNTVFGSQHQMDVALLDKLIREDIEAGRLPLLLIANAAPRSGGKALYKCSPFTIYKLARLKDLCEQYNIWLHVGGVNLATLVAGQVTSAILAAARCDSMTLTPGPWLGLPAVAAVTLYRHENPALSLAAGLTSSQPVAKLRALPLWLSLQYLGHNGIVQKVTHAAALVSMTDLKPIKVHQL
ncbi:pyridoxal-dependent decarboxylase domain-containing protein 1-like [Brachionichthys hirsutus]|uniref:pyridoxal-dependent decarboxylase domain-containing protein 1-like n=1 Tax=Brachionichthys hirsutus TaxID=412623 RepID=UPI003604772F